MKAAQMDAVERTTELLSRFSLSTAAPELGRSANAQYYGRPRGRLCSSGARTADGRLLFHVLFNHSRKALAINSGPLSKRK